MVGQGKSFAYLLVQISLVESEDARRGGNVSVRSSLCVWRGRDNVPRQRELQVSIKTAQADCIVAQLTALD